MQSTLRPKMSIATTFTPSNHSLGFAKLDLNRSSHPQSPLFNLSLRTSAAAATTTNLTWRANLTPKRPVLVFSRGDGIGGGNGRSSGGGGGGGDGGEGEGKGFGKNREEAFLALAEIGRSLDSLPKDLAAAVESGRIPGSIVLKYFELEKSPFLRWLLQFGGFKERLLADDLFLFKVFMECGVGLFTKVVYARLFGATFAYSLLGKKLIISKLGGTAAEYQKRKENFFKELEFVFADVVMAIIADFMLVYLPAPTVSLRPPIGVNAGAITKFFYNCPENAFQVALAGTSYSFPQRIGAIVRNGAKLFAVGTTSSLVGTVVTNALINAKKAVDKSSADEVENVPVLATSVGYGVYMAISSNLRYQVLAGVIEQRFLEPLLHQHKLMLSATCFAVRTGNTFLGSLLWVDYARWIGVQKAEEVEE